MKRSLMTLQDCSKGYTLDQDKVCTPRETVERFKKLLQEVDLDILREVKRIDTGRLGIPVYFSICGRDAYQAIGNKKQMGKGSTPDQSQASACMELAERFSFFSFIKNPANFLTDTYNNLLEKGEPVLGLEYLLQSVHDTTTSPEELKILLGDLPMRWTWATNLHRNQGVLVPFSWFYAINEFNGPSAGNTYEEAIIQGISEIIERHVCAVVTRERLRTPRIDPDSVTDPVARELIHKFTRHGIRLYLNDFTLDTGIPTVAALAMDPATFPDRSEIVYTAGTTPDPHKALIRALTEVAQLAGDFETKSNYVASGLPKPLSLDEVDYLVNTSCTVSIQELPDLSDQNLKKEIENYLEALDRLGMEVLLVDTMHPQLNVPAIYTIIPGAHFRERSMIENSGLFAAKIVHDQITDPEEQLIHFERMREIRPDAYYLEFYLGKNLMARGLHHQAEERFRRSLELSPMEEDIPYIYAFLGDCLKEMGEYDQALAVLRQGLAHDEERPDIHNLLGFCHFKRGEHEEAAHHFARAVELNPASAIDHANLGINLKKLNRLDEAAHCLKLALTMDPSLEFARPHLEELMNCREA